MEHTVISFWTLLIAIFASMALGAIWYSPLLFGKTWAESHNFGMIQLKPTFKEYLGTFFLTLVLVWVFSCLLDWLNIAGLGATLKFASLIWLGFVTTTHFSGVIWARKPFTAYLIDTLYHLINLLLIGTILALWR